MARLVSLGAVLAFVSFCHTSAQQSVGTVVVDDGRIGIGLITGGNFGPGSFSIGGSSSSRPQPSVYVNEDDKDGQHVIIQTATNHKGQQENYQTPQNGGGNSGNTQLYPVKPLTTHANQGQGSNGGEGGSGGSQILIGAVILNNNKHNIDNKNKNDNKQPELNPATLEAIFGSNDENNVFPNEGNGFSKTGEQGSIQIASITGGNFQEGTMNINKNNKPATDVLQKGSAANHRNTGNTNSGTEAQYFKGHGANDGAGKAGVSSNHGQTNSGSSEEPWIWER